jgi:succinate-semialdehyde dehydrogenase/glutarate-semialdehyde dehydrogenase
MPFQTINPATDEVLASFESLTQQELKIKLDASAEAFELWRKTDFARRKELMHKAGDYLLLHKEEFGKTITLEMGKPLKQAIAEIEKCASCCQYYANYAEDLLSPHDYTTDYSFSEVHLEPIGIVYAVMPWNFPFWQALRCAVPAIMAGNVVVLKHSANVPQCALELEKILTESGFPNHVYANLFIEHELSDYVIEYPQVQGISLTGSERAGSHIASVAGKVIKRSVMELGGSDPFIILGDADVEAAAKVGTNARMQNNGQSCIAAKRFIVEETVAEKFTEAFLRNIMALKIGNPMEDGIDIGPLARRDLMENLDKQVQQTVAMGAKVLTGGKPKGGAGAFYLPTILTDIPKDSPAYKDELFGPVASLFVVKDREEAIKLANDTTFGLGASLWTADTKLAQEISKDIQSGSVYINTMVKSDPRIPFGGIKRSGYGRELSDFGIMEFVNIKTICIA